jgi:hypothetical protein
VIQEGIINKGQTVFEPDMGWMRFDMDSLYQCLIMHFTCARFIKCPTYQWDPG